MNKTIVIKEKETGKYFVHPNAKKLIILKDRIEVGISLLEWYIYSPELFELVKGE